MIDSCLLFSSSLYLKVSTYSGQHYVILDAVYYFCVLLYIFCCRMSFLQFVRISSRLVIEFPPNMVNFKCLVLERKTSKNRGKVEFKLDEFDFLCLVSFGQLTLQVFRYLCVLDFSKIICFEFS